MIGAITAGLFSAGAAPAAATSYESIATQTVGSGGVASVTFSSIPSTYKHLQIRFIGRSTVSNVNDGYISMRFNSDSGGNYTFLHYLQGDGATASAGALYTSGWDNIYSSIAAGNTATASVFGTGIVDILDYTSTNKYKVVRHLSGMDNNGAGKVGLGSGNWNTTNAITSITLGANGFGSNWTQYSSFALYGIKG